MKITLKASIHHGLLFEAAKKLSMECSNGKYGGIRQLARRLGISYGVLIRWVNLKPPTQENVDKYGIVIMTELSSILGRPVSIEDVFPDAYIKHKEQIPNRIETSQELPVTALLSSIGRPLLKEPEEIVFERERSEALSKMLQTLSPREREILSLRFGLDGQEEVLPLTEVARRFGIGRERIRQIESKALRRLRHPSRAEKLKPFLEALR